MNLNRLVVGAGEVLACHDILQQPLGDNLPLVQKHGMRKPRRYFFHMVGDHDDRRGVRICGQFTEQLDEVLATSEVQAGAGFIQQQ